MALVATCHLLLHKRIGMPPSQPSYLPQFQCSPAQAAFKAACQPTSDRRCTHQSCRRYCRRRHCPPPAAKLVPPELAPPELLLRSALPRAVSAVRSLAAAASILAK